jgi:hypothetical protein
VRLLALAFEYGGTPVDVPASWLLGFCGFCFLLVVMTVYFNRSTNHDAYYVDEHWGDGSIDDDDWALAILDARRAANSKLRDLVSKQ